MLEHYIISFTISKGDSGKGVKVYYAGLSEGVDMATKRNEAQRLDAQNAEEIVSWLRQSDFSGMNEIKIELDSTVNIPKDIPEIREFITIHIEENKYNTAMAYIDVLLNTSNDFVFEDWFKKGYCHFMIDQHEKAIESYKFANNMEPDNFQTLSNIAISLLSIEKASDAFDYFQKALSINPYIAPAWLHIGDYYLARSEESDLSYEKAINALKRAIQIAPHLAERKIYCPRNDNITSIQKMIDVSGYINDMSDEEILALSWLDKANEFNKNNENDEALKYYNKHLELYPKEYSALNNMGVIQMNSGPMCDAKNAFIKAITIKKDYAVGWYNLAKVYREEGDYAASIDSCKRVVEINPEYDDVWTTLGNNCQWPLRLYALLATVSRLMPRRLAMARLERP